MEILSATFAVTIQNFLETSVELSPSFAMVLAAVIHVALLGAFFGLPAFALIWAERKVAGRIQDRLGPTRVGGRFGWLQSLADGVKLIQKEDLAPEEADKILFRLSPYIVVVSSFMAFMFLPFSYGWAAVVMDVGVFLMFAVMSIEVVGIILAGYSSGSKWALFGGMREAAQMVSYEVPLGIVALVPLIAVGSLNFMEIGQVQTGWFINWLIFHDPFTFIAFFVYFVVATAACKRAPFDLAEAESELVAGFHTEYSGMRWSFFFLAEYASMFAVGGIAAFLFLGAWNTGLEFLDAPLNQMRAATQGQSEFVIGSFLTAFLANVFGMVVFMTKGAALVFVQIWVRWTLPRLRIDQVMTTCLKYLIPISCFLFLGAILWPLVLVATTGRTQILDWESGSPSIGRQLGTMRSASLVDHATPPRVVKKDVDSQPRSQAEKEVVR